MIARLTGKLLEKRPPTVVVDVAGVGYEVDVPMSTFYELPELSAPVTLLTHLVVREDAHLLFGFRTDAERSAFRQLIKVSGVGARMALALLSGLSVNELSLAITGQDSSRLTRVPGIGKKTADRLILELKDKLDPQLAASVASTPADQVADIQNALLALGYAERDARAVIQKLSPDLSVSDGIRAALKMLAR